MTIRGVLSSATTIASAATIIGVFSLLSRLTGFLRDRILTDLFPGNVLDVYFQAFRIPDLLFQLLVTGALSASFIPIFAKHWYRDDEERAFRYVNMLLHAILVIFGVGMIVAIIAAPLYTPLIGRGFSPEDQALLLRMTRVVFVGQLAFAVSFVFGSLLQGAKRFFLPSLAPLVYNGGIIVGTTLFRPPLGEMGLAWGVVLGAVAHAILQVIGAVGVGYRYRFAWPWFDAEVWRTFRQAIPRSLALAVNQANFLFMTAFATLLYKGAVRDFSFAYNLNYFPIGIVAVSYAVAAFPTFSEKAAKGDLDGLRASLSLSLRQVLFFMIPATFLFLILRAQVVRVVYGADGLSWPSTIAIADALGYFALSFVAQSAVYLFVRAYYAMQMVARPFFVGVAAVVLNILIAPFFVERFGMPGLAIAFSLSSIFQIAGLAALLYRRLGGLDGAKLLKSLLVLSIAGVFSAFVAQIVKTAIGEAFPLTTFWAVFFQAVTAGMVGIFIYGGLTYFMKSSEMLTFLAGLRVKFLRAAEPKELADNGEL